MHTITAQLLSVYTLFSVLLLQAFAGGGTLLAHDPLEPPSALTAQKTADGIRLSWTAPEGNVTGYRINRRPELGEDTLTRMVDDTGSKATTYTDTDVRITDEVYIYRVTALRNGVRSKLSAGDRVEVGPGDFGASSGNQDNGSTTTTSGQLR